MRAQPGFPRQAMAGFGDWPERREPILVSRDRPWPSAWLVKTLGRDIVDFWPNPPPIREDRMAGDEITLAASASRSLVVSLPIPSNAAAVWWWWAQSIGTAGDLVNITWTLEVNGAPVIGFSSLRSRDAFGILSIPQWVGLVVPGGSTLRVVATNETASAINNVGAYIRAYWSRGLQ